jgi:carboxylesterase
MKNIIIYVVLGLVSLFYSCSSKPDIDNEMLDSGMISYAIPDSLQKHLVSQYILNPTSEKDTPVIIVAHGYTATTFEWDELRRFANKQKSFYVSQVLLGGHGRSYEVFKNTSWQDWQSSIIEEYRKLDSLGFKKIYLAGSSTGAPLIINMVKSGFFNQITIQPKGIFLIDPIVVSSNKTLTMVGLLGPMLGYLTTKLDSGEKGHWYVYRPQESLKQLMTLINITRLDLQKGIILPVGTYMKVYKSRTDDVADPISALMIYKGIKASNGAFIDTEMMESKLHVFTRLDGRAVVTPADIVLQQKVFTEIETRMKNY